MSPEALKLIAEINTALERYRPEQVKVTAEGALIDEIAAAQPEPVYAFEEGHPNEALNGQAMPRDHRTSHDGVYLQRRNMPGFSVRGTGPAKYRKHGEDGKFVKDEG